MRIIAQDDEDKDAWKRPWLLTYDEDTGLELRASGLGQGLELRAVVTDIILRSQVRERECVCICREKERERVWLLTYDEDTDFAHMFETRHEGVSKYTHIHTHTLSLHTQTLLTCSRRGVKATSDPRHQKRKSKSFLYSDFPIFIALAQAMPGVPNVFLMCSLCAPNALTFENPCQEPQALQGHSHQDSDEGAQR